MAGKQGGLTPEEVNSRKKSQFLRVLLENGGFREAAIRTCHTSRRWFNDQMDGDEEFALAVETITDITNEQLLAEVRRRATGYDEDVIFQGKRAMEIDANGNAIPLRVRKYSDNLLMFLVKGRMPEYRDGPRANKVGEVSDDEMNAAILAWMKRNKGKLTGETLDTADTAMT